MKPIQNFILLLFPVFSFCQLSTPELYGEYNLFLDEELNSSVYHKISFGSQLTSFKYIAPEIDVSYYFGANTLNRFDAEQTGPATYWASLHHFFEGFMWGLSPKLFYEEQGTKIVLIPKYHFGKVRAEGNFLDSEGVALEKKTKSKLHYWSFALGIEESKWSKNETYGFYLYCSGFNAGNALNSLNFSEQQLSKNNYNTRTFGIGFRVSHNFKKSK